MKNPSISFPLFKLPEVPLVSVIEEMELGAIYNLSRTSPEVRRLLQEILRGEFARNTRIDVISYDDQQEITVRKPGKQDFIWSCQVSKKNIAFVEQISLKVTEDGFPMYIGNTVEMAFSYFIGKTLQFQKLFQCQIGSFTWKMSYFPAIHILKFPMFENCEKLDVTFDDYQECLLYVLKNFRKAKHLVCCPGISEEENRFTDVPIVYEKVSFRRCYWMKLSNLEQMMRDCRKIALDEASPDMLNAALKSWLAGSSKNLEFLEIKRSMGPEEVLEGLETFEAPRNRPYASKGFQGMCDYVKMFDLERRKSDGALVSVCFSKDRDDRFVSVVVWYDTEKPFPEGKEPEWKF